MRNENPVIETIKTRRSIRQYTVDGCCGFRQPSQKTRQWRKRLLGKESFLEKVVRGA